MPDERPEPTDRLPPPEGVPQDGLSERHREALRRFLHLWGEMASHWGINRTMAQIHALLYAAARPLDTDEIMELLDISRGNANMNLRSLLEWRLARKVHLEGSRKDYYVGETDPWKISSRIIEERQRREIKPVGEALQGCITELRTSPGPPLSEAERTFLGRMEAMGQFMQTFEEVTEALLPFLHERNAGKVRQLTGFAARLGGRTHDDEGNNG